MGLGTGDWLNCGVKEMRIGEIGLLAGGFTGDGENLGRERLVPFDRRVATSPMMRVSCSSVTVPGRGTVSRPVPQTEE